MDRWLALTAALLIIAAGTAPVDGSRLIADGGDACTQLRWRILHPSQVSPARCQCAMPHSLAARLPSGPLRFLTPTLHTLHPNRDRHTQDLVRCFDKRLASSELPSWTRVRAPPPDLPHWADLRDEASPRVLRRASAASPLCRPEVGGVADGQLKSRKPCCVAGQPCTLRPAAITFFDAR